MEIEPFLLGPSSLLALRPTCSPSSPSRLDSPDDRHIDNNNLRDTQRQTTDQLMLHIHNACR